MVQISKNKILNSIPDYIVFVGEELQKNCFEAFLVGGCVRDILLNRKPGDFDIATNAYPEEIIKIFSKSIPTGAKFGTITVVVPDGNGENFSVQITTYRSEEDYFGARWPSKVNFTRNIKDDLSRRDFTINALAINLQEFDNTNVTNKEIIFDLFGGLKDLDLKIIKTVGDPIERLSEDGLRSVRACRLASQLEFSIELNTFEAIKQTLHITKQISVERFREEFEKLIYKSSKPSVGLRLMYECGILQIFIPELCECVGIVQPKFHVDDVFEHSLKTLDIAPDEIKIAALLHDIAKPRCKTEDEKGIHFYGHDILGAQMSEEILKRLRFPNHVINEVKTLIRWHMFSFEAIKQTLHITKQISVERFREEFEKLIYKSSKPSVGLRLMYECGILQIFIPELCEGVGVVQPQFHVDDVFEHSLKTLDIAPDEVKIAALFHDVAKPRCKTEDEKGIHFYGHDILGAQMSEEILKRLRFPNHVINEVKTLIRWHMFYYPSADWRENKNEKTEHLHGWSDSAIRRLINNVGGVKMIDKLLKLRIADAYANPKSDFNPSEIEALSQRIADVLKKSTALTIKDLDINGKDLMENFQLKPGKQIGEILRYLLDKVIEEPGLNKKLDLLRLAKDFIEKRELII